MSQSGSKQSSAELLLDALFEEAQASSATEIRENLRADGVDPERLAVQMRAMAHDLVTESRLAEQRTSDRDTKDASESRVVDRHDATPEHARRLSEEAAGWFLRLTDNELSSGHRKKFLAWLRRSPQNVAELLRMASIDRCLRASPPRQIAERTPEHVPQRADRLRWTVGALAAVLVAGVFVGREYTESEQMVTTGASEWRSRTLEDGSSVKVDARSRIRVDYTAHERTVHLFQGSAVFQVTKDPHRPFVVRTHLVDVTAVGTRFGVSIGAGVVATVSEGTVRVTGRGRPDGKSVTLNAGEQFRALDSNLASSQVAQVDAERALQWARNGRLNLGGMTVAEGVEEFNRRNRVQIVVQSRALAALVIPVANVPANEPTTYATAVAAEPGVHMSVDQKNNEIRLSD